MRLGRREAKKAAETEIKLTLLNKEYEHMESILDSALLGPEAQKQWAKAERKKLKQAAKKEKKLYMWDWSVCVDPAAKFENLVASNLLKW